MRVGVCCFGAANFGWVVLLIVLVGVFLYLHVRVCFLVWVCGLFVDFGFGLSFDCFDVGGLCWCWFVALVLLTA